MIMRTTTRQKSLFSRRLIELRNERDLTQHQLAEALHISRDAVAYLETRARNPTMETVKMVAGYFQVNPETLIDTPPTSRRPGRLSKLERQMQMIRALPKDQQKAISTVLDMALHNVSSAD